MRVESFEYFITIAEGSTFLDASIDHNISQSSLSKAIIALENDLGVKLLDRGHYPVTLTKPGRQLYEDLKELAPGYRKLRRHIRAYVQKRDVSCCVVPSVTICGLKHAFDQFLKLHKDIPIHTSRYRDPNLAVEALQKDEIDFCVMHKPFVPKPQLHMTFLKDDPLYVLLPGDHPLASSSSISLSSLNEETFLATPYGYTILRDLGETVTVLPPNIQKGLLRADIINSISFGTGAAIFYESDISPFRTNNIAVRRLAEMPNNPLVLAVSSLKQLTAWQKTFRNYLISVLRK
jgi:DNA-binding transcriptional LysR family regulator